MKLKNLICVALSLVMLTGIFSINTFAVTGGDFEYSLIDGSAEITAYKGSSDSVTIPEAFGGYTVTSIGEQAFRRSALKSVVIPDTVKEIKADAFADSRSLTTVKFSSNLEAIGDTAFYNCENLSSALRFPESLKTIGNSAFENCWDMSYAVIPESVEDIGYCALGYYYDTDSADNKYYDFKRSDFRILGYKNTEAENYCDSQSVDFYDLSTGVNAFTSNGIDYFVNTDSEAEVIAFADTSAAPAIPSEINGYSVKSIGDMAFYASALKSVTIPESVTKIGEWAFENCDNLKSVKVPPTVTTINEGAFGYYYDGFVNRKYDDFTICGAENSAAQTYAESLGFEFDEAYTTVVTLSKSSGTVYLNGSLKVKAKVKNPIGKTTFTSADKKIAKVTSSGTVSGIKKGKVKITIANNNVKKTFTVNVKKPKLNKTSVTIKRNKIYKLKVIGKVGAAKFISGNKNILKVNSKNGNYKGLAPGKTYISVKTNGIKLKCKVTIK